MSKFSDNSQALAAFFARKTKIDMILACLTAPTSGRFSCEPGTVTWADVGTLANYLKGLREISDAAFQECEHAASLLRAPSLRAISRRRGLGW